MDSRFLHVTPHPSNSQLNEIWIMTTKYLCPLISYPPSSSHFKISTVLIQLIARMGFTTRRRSSWYLHEISPNPKRTGPSALPRPTSGAVAVIDFCYPQDPDVGGLSNTGCPQIYSSIVGETVGSGRDSVFAVSLRIIHGSNSPVSTSCSYP